MALQTNTITASGVALSGLVTPAEYYAFTNNSSPENVAQIEAAIFDATEYIMNRNNRWYVGEAQAITVTEQFSGNGEVEYTPKQGDVISVGAAQLWNGISWDTIDQSVYLYETDGNQIFSRNTYLFTKGRLNWKITYTFGMRGGIPRDLKRACLEIARYYVSKRAAGDIQSEATGEQSFTYFRNEKFPDEEPRIVAGKRVGASDVALILDKYVRYYTYG